MATRTFAVGIDLDLTDSAGDSLQDALVPSALLTADGFAPETITKVTLTVRTTVDPAGGWLPLVVFKCFEDASQADCTWSSSTDGQEVGLDYIVRATSGPTPVGLFVADGAVTIECTPTSDTALVAGGDDYFEVSAYLEGGAGAATATVEVVSIEVEFTPLEHAAVQIAFGKGVGDTVTEGDWIDVTDDLDTRVGIASVIATSGRRNRRDQITPGSLNFALENDSGDYDPSNSSGPYYGDLKLGVPVRVVTTYDDTAAVRWRGFVASPWAQEIRRYHPVVPVTAHDLFGLMAAGSRDWPTAYESTIERASIGTLTHWWRAGPTGWIDAVSGERGNWSAVPTSIESPVVGEATTWAQPWSVNDEETALPPEGRAELPPLWKENPSGDLAFSIVWEGDPQVDEPVVVCSQDRLEDDVFQTCLIQFGGSTYGNRHNLDFILPNADGDLVWVMDGPSHFLTNIWGDEIDWDQWQVGLHHLLVVVPDGTAGSAPYPLVWIDGVQYEVGSTLTTPLNVPSAPIYSPATRGTLDLESRTLLGDGGSGSDPTGRPGYVDHLVTWDDVTASESELGDLAAEMWSTLRSRRQTLDERLEDVATIAGVGHYVGTLDASGIETAQSYKPGAPAERMQEIEDTEQGRVWIDASGLLRFSRRQWSWEDTVSTEVQLTITNNPTTLDGSPTTTAEPLESGADIGFDPLDLTNRAAVNSTYGRQQQYSDATSIASIGIRNPITLDGLLHAQDAQSLAIAEWLVKSSLTENLKVRRLGIRVEDNPEVLGPFAQQVEEGWLIGWELVLATGTVEGQGHVIGITHEWSKSASILYLDLDPARTGWSFFEWGVSEWGGDDGWAF